MRTEMHRLTVFACEPQLLLLLLLTLLASIAGYARPFQYDLPIGSAADHRPYLLAGFNLDRERTASESPATFRWAFGDARLAFPAVGVVAHAVTLRVVTAQPTTSVPSGWSNGDVPLLAVPLTSSARQYHVLVPGGSSNLDLRMTTPTFNAANDPRDLAFATDGLEIAAFGASVPPMSVLWLVLSVVLSYLLMRHWNIPPGWTLGVCAIIVCCLGLLLAYQRLGLTTFAPRLGSLLGAAYVGTVLLIPLLLASAQMLRIVTTATEIRSIAALVMLAWIIRLGGLLHPQAYTNDLGLHAHNLEGVVRGQVIFTENLPGEAGGGPAPYPPAQYVMLLPFGGLINTGLLLQAGTTLADSLTIMWGWLLLRAAGGTAGAALWAGGLYLFALPTLWSSLVGETANVWGQALVAPMMLGLWHWENMRPPPAARGWLSFAFVPAISVMFALLGHFGVFLSLLVFFGTYAVILLLLRGPWIRLSVLVACGVFTSAALYYGAHLELVMASPQRGTVPFGWGRLLGELGKALKIGGFLGPLVPALGILGLIIIMWRMPSLRTLMLAWWLSTIASLGSLLWTQQALRWTVFLFPALAWSGGVALATIASRGRNGRVSACTALAVLIFFGAAVWYSQIVSYKH